MIYFSDSDKFNIDDFGIVRHKRDGTSYADVLINGVALDTSLHFDSMQYCYFEEDKETHPSIKQIDIKEVVNSRKIYKNKKFYRKRKGAPTKKKKYPTKPRSHKRISKLAEHLGNINNYTYENACYEIDKYNELKKEGQIDIYKDYVNNNKGFIAIIELEIDLIDEEPFIEIDCAGINLCSGVDKEWYIPYDNIEKEKRYFIAYYNPTFDEYMWQPYDTFSRLNFSTSFVNRFEDIKKNLWIDEISYQKNTVDWEYIWSYMDYIRTGKVRNYDYVEEYYSKPPTMPKMCFR